MAASIAGLRESTDRLAAALADGRRVYRRWLASIGAAVAVAVVALGGLVWLRATEPEPPWDPLGTYDVPQLVRELRNAQQEPVVYLGDNPSAARVHVEGTKCYGPEPVQVIGELAWRTTNPPGSLLAGQTFPASDPRDGCRTLTFENPIPPAVLEAVAAFDRPTVWQIAGTDTPIDGERLGVRRDWFTEPFVLDPGRPPKGSEG